MGAELNFGERLKEARKTKGLTQRQVAEEFGITKVGYQNYEYGRREPSIPVLCRLADFYNVSLDYLFGRTDEPQLLDKATLAAVRQIQGHRAGEAAK